MTGPAVPAPPIAPVPPPHFISFSAQVNDNTTQQLVAAMNQCRLQGAQEVHLLISTPGGSVMNGITLYNVLKGMPFKLVTHNIGNIDSIGNAIFLAGTERYACGHSTFMFHGVSSGIQGLSALDARSLRERLQSVVADEKRIGSIIEQRTQLTHREVLALFREARTKDASYALANGLINAIQDVNIPAGSPMLTLVVQ